MSIDIGEKKQQEKNTHKCRCKDVGPHLTREKSENLKKLVDYYSVVCLAIVIRFETNQHQENKFIIYNQVG